jgi:hypothetical protein
MDISTKTVTESIAGATSVANAPDKAKSGNALTPFDPIDGIDFYRPFFGGPIEHDSCGSTIVITKPSQPQPGVKSNIDYLTNFSTYIEAAIPGNYSSDSEVPVLDEVGNANKNEFLGIFKNFSILAINEVRAEISQIILNFGNKWNAYFFGSQPRMYAVAGVFMDAVNYPYYEQFMIAYDNYLAGGKCAEQGFKLYFVYDGKIVSGWILGIDTSHDVADRFTKGFSFKILVEDEGYFRVNYAYDKDGNVVSSGIGKGHRTNQYLIPGINKNL